MKKLDGKVALVTGASHGIGQATAIKLADEGAFVIVNYNKSKKAAQSVVESITSRGGKAYALHGNIADVAAIKAMFDQLDNYLQKELGSATLDILVNNAGVMETVPFADTTEAQFNNQFDINVKGMFFVTQCALPRLKNGGRIINLSSCVSHYYFPGIMSYSITKGAVNVLTRHLAAELGERNITVNAVAPGAIVTPGMNPDLEADKHQQQETLAEQAIKRVGQPEDIANAIAMLAGDEAAWVTGQVIEVSGGTKL